MKLLTLFVFFAFIFNQYAQQYTPIPTDVKGIEKATHSLNGTWQFNPSPEKSFWKSEVSKKWKEIEVPGEWVMQGYNVKPHTRAAYSKEFSVPNDWNNSEIILRCDAIYSDAIVYVNDQKVGVHKGGFNAFEFNVTQFLKLREKNNISIGVMSESFSDTIVSATQYAAHQLGGITRKIYLFALPKIHISDLEVTTTFDEEYKNAKLGIKYRFQNNSKSDLSNAKIVFTLISPDGKSKEFGEKNINAIEGNIEFNIDEPEKWNAEYPNLYTLKVELKNGKDSEVIHRKIGFRQIEVIGNQFYVNGKPIKLKGVNRHEVHPLRGRSLTEELWRKDAQIFKEGNCNYIRTSHYPPAEEFIAYCDSIGLFVELEAPFCWIGHNANIKFKRKEQLPENMAEIYKPRLAETIEFYRKHPSIIIWSMANESSWTEEWNKAKEYINKLDNTRPKSFHDQDYGGYNNYGSTTEISNIHYPGPNGADNVKNYNRPILFGEYTHLNTYNRKEIATDPGVRDAWGRGFEPMWNNMYYSRGCLGGAIWSGIDDVFYLPSGKAVGYGEWGPIDGWRRKKPEYWHMKKTYSPIKIHNKNIKKPEKGEAIFLQIENRYDFTNLKDCSIEWSLGDETGVLKPDIAPRSYGYAKVPYENITAKVLSIEVYDSFKRFIDKYEIRIGDNGIPVYPNACIDFDNLSLKKDKEQIVISNEEFEWIFDAKSGEILRVELNKNEILTEGATLMMLPLKSGACLTEHSLEVSVLNNTCTEWNADSVDASETEEGIKVLVKGNYNEATSSVNYLFKPNGEISVDYQIKTKIEIDPRQLGVVFTCKREYETLSWERKGQWTAYPESHIGRTRGEAKLFEQGKYEFEFGKQPEWDWKFDSNFLGTNDFRSTKDFIYWASLTNATGKGIVILSDGDDSFRAFADKGNISFLVAGFVTGGSDIFYAAHLKNERKKLKKGDEFIGSFKIKFVN